MGHKADVSFFDKKRSWSKRKDAILGYYLEPYLAKVARRPERILIVDGFAGPGKFGDGHIGSPLIMCAKARGSPRKGDNICVHCIEPDFDLFGRLEKNLSAFKFAEAINTSFGDYVSRLLERVQKDTVFLYLDPFTPYSLEWEPIRQLLEASKRARTSFEVFLNFQSPTFVRCGLAALGQSVPEHNQNVEDTEGVDASIYETASVDKLNRIVGGNWWVETLNSSTDFASQFKGVAEGVHARLKEWLPEALSLPIKASDEHVVPRYYLMFGSRSYHGLELMNEAMAATRKESVFFTDLFSQEDLEHTILSFAAQKISRGELILAVIRKLPCRYRRTDIRGAVERLLKNGSLRSASGRSRISDTVEIWRQA